MVVVVVVVVVVVKHTKKGDKKQTKTNTVRSMARNKNSNQKRKGREKKGVKNDKYPLFLDHELHRWPIASPRLAIALCPLPFALAPIHSVLL